MSEALAPRLHNALITALALVCTYALAFYWNLDKPFWAAFAVFIVSLPTIGQSLQKGLLRTLGTLMGTGVALLLFMLFPQERLALFLTLSVYLAVMMALMSGSRTNGYFFYMSSIVTMIIVLMASANPQREAFHLAVYRTEETLLGIAVYTLITLLLEPRSAFEKLNGGLHELVAGHGELFRLNELPDRHSRMLGMYKKYNEMKELLDTLEQLVPAVRLENYQVYRKAACWREAIRCSADLLEIQRQWTGTLTAMRDLNLETLLPEFEARRRDVGRLIALIGDPEGTLPETLPRLEMDREKVNALDPSLQGLVSTIRGLFRDQVGRCLELRGLVAHLLWNAPAPSLPRRSRERTIPLISAKQRSDIAQTLLIFWSVVLIWVLFDPPGTESASFLELTVLLGLSALFTGPVDPLAQIFYYMAGIFCTGLLYLFVYPVVSDLGLFMLLTFVLAFAISFLFPRREQGAMKMGFMMPWLAVGHYTNVPAYSFMNLAAGSFTLLVGISLSSLIRYVFFSPNEEVLFLRRQTAFFREAERLLARFCNDYHGQKPGFVTRLRYELALRRLHLVVDGLNGMVGKLPVQVMEPEIARLFCAEAKDIGVALQRLYADAVALGGRLEWETETKAEAGERRETPGDKPPLPELSGGEGIGGTLEPENSVSDKDGQRSGSAPVSGLERRVRAMQETTERLLDILHERQRRLEMSAPAASGPEDAAGEMLRSMSAQCGSILKGLLNTLGVARSAPWTRHEGNHF